jgi:hypothetical protein
MIHHFDVVLQERGFEAKRVGRTRIADPVTSVRALGCRAFLDGPAATGSIPALAPRCPSGLCCEI